jgi:hypothetical protein
LLMLLFGLEKNTILNQTLALIKVILKLKLFFVWINVKLVKQIKVYLWLS